ncbi:MAG TPA: HD domain-containing protein, partial [Chloroflexota bacterium]|nr:HD domain-containing protein [Chloroflexota bacterium]
DPLDIPGLVRRSVLSDEELRQWLSDTIATIRNRPLRSLLEDNLGEGSCWRREYLRVPAGLHYHHAYLGGLADHVREMAEVWQSSVSTFPRVDRDLTLGGILLHDIGKLDTFSSGAMPQIAESGRYMDHITAGIGRLTLAMDARHDFPPLLRDHLLHILASHHGEKEHGSPVVPATREAIVVHHLDRMSSLLSHLDEWTRQSRVDQFGWSTDASPWLKTSVALATTIPDDFLSPDEQA